MFGSDVGDDHMQAAAIRKHRVDKGAREVDAVDLPYVIRRSRRVRYHRDGTSDQSY